MGKIVVRGPRCGAAVQWKGGGDVVTCYHSV